MNNNQSIDTQRVYCTSAIVKTVGRAVAISLADATLPGTTRNKHMTVLFRKHQRWNDNEIESISRETDSWIQKKYGHNKAPVTFTIESHGAKSVKIVGDLHDLCLHLRLTFSALSSDEQRVPHVELFRHKAHKAPKHPKVCHICGDGSHLKRNCPQKNKKRNGKMNKRNMKPRVPKMISRIDDLTAKKQQELELLHEEKRSLSQLLSKDFVSQHDIKSIAKSFKHQRKQLRIKNKSSKSRKMKASKLKKFSDKKERKEEQQRRKAERHSKKAERKRLKQERLQKLDAARMVSLPSNIGNCSTLNIHIDGYNIIGCDSVCRKSMRGRNRGRKEARARLINLVQKQFCDAIQALHLSYNVSIKVWFDGNGANMKTKDVSVLYSTRKQSVDDKLVEMFTGENNANVLVITSDRELTLRLHDIGCKVMKSGVFYKTFLKEKEVKDSTVDIMDEEELKEDIECLNPTDEDFVKVIQSKMNCGETGGTDAESSDSLEQIEGDENIDDDSEDNDEEFTTIYGEDMEIDTLF